MSYSIIIENLYKHFKGAEFPTIQNLSLQFHKGKICGLLGPNGAGKTTTLSILFGLIQQDSGTATIFGLDTIKDKNELRKIIGIVPQQIALYPQLTARENLTYFGQLYKIPKQALKQKIEHLLQRFGLENNADKKITHFSGGMKRRANIIAGLLHQPQMLILDEPTSGVDVQSRTMILDFLKEYNQLGNTIIYTSHLLEEAERICDEVAVMDMGKLIALDTPHRLIQNTQNCKNLEDVFLYYTGRTVREG